MGLAEPIERQPLFREDRGVLRFITAGSVDDGKSTLIGRLLHDTRAVFEDQLAAVARVSRRRGNEHIDLSLLTDGLEAEREQGITIDVAYRYFSTPRRKFIIADSPGHEQYTRNMVTAASTAGAAVILVDARKGVLPQTRRHTYIARLLGVRHVIVAVNKMDLVGFDESVFERIRSDYLAFVSALRIADLRFIPISALHGDLVVERGPNMNWYAGPTLLSVLEEIDATEEAEARPLRFPVQLVVRAGAGKDFRGYAGRVESGSLSRGTEVVAMASGRRAVVEDIVSLAQSLPVAAAGASVSVVLADDIDLSRGDMLADPISPPRAVKAIDARICWLSSLPLDARAVSSARFVLKHTTRSVPARFASLESRVDVNTLEQHAAPAGLVMNDIARVGLALAQPVFVDSYRNDRVTGSFILIDDVTHQTLAAGMIE
ncbi:MAG TPA: GTP-binding protein [Burkholderiales bacterium]|nr:GTP-binding protein [Burkholderiales bacterium]